MGDSFVRLNGPEVTLGGFLALLGELATTLGRGARPSFGRIAPGNYSLHAPAPAQGQLAGTHSVLSDSRIRRYPRSRMSDTT